MKPGDVIGLCSDNRKEFPIPLVATFLIGCTVAPINYNYSERKKLSLYYFNFTDKNFRRDKPCNRFI